MEPRPHERGNERRKQAQIQPTRGFNGAPSSRTWKPEVAFASLLVVRPASMEPRPHERGNPRGGGGTSSGSPSFNGATSSRTWKRRDERHSPCRVFASMEPRPHERGNLRVNLDKLREVNALQWS